jgi:hypothetical protein
MGTTQNGWPVLSLDDMQQWRIPQFTQTTMPLLPNNPGFVLAHLASWFHDNVERLDPSWDDWGWSAPRRIIGSDLYSNHCSGTAVDLNADRHAQGDRGTFTDRQARKIQRRLQTTYPCLRWGGNYRTVVDEMHFEINVPVSRKSEVDDVARMLRSTVRGEKILALNH